MTGDFKQKIPLRKALLYVFLSVCLIWGSLSVTWWYHSRTLQERQKNPLYSITTLLQTSKNWPIPTWQLAELVGLSHDIHTNLYCFDTAAATEKLQACPVIKKAVVRKIRPRTIHIDYETREAKALIADIDSLACDSEGVVFPLSPFFSPKRLVEVYLGVKNPDQEITWNKPLESDKLELAFAIIDFASAHFPARQQLLRVDVHKAFAPSAGEREIVLLCEEDREKSFVRLRTNAFEHDLRVFLSLHDQLKKMRQESSVDAQIVDLRSPGIVLVK